MSLLQRRHAPADPKSQSAHERKAAEEAARDADRLARRSGDSRNPALFYKQAADSYKRAYGLWRAVATRPVSHGLAPARSTDRDNAIASATSAARYYELDARAQLPSGARMGISGQLDRATALGSRTRSYRAAIEMLEAAISLTEDANEAHAISLRVENLRGNVRVDERSLKEISKSIVSGTRRTA